MDFNALLRLLQRAERHADRGEVDDVATVFRDRFVCAGQRSLARHADAPRLGVCDTEGAHAEELVEPAAGGVVALPRLILDRHLVLIGAEQHVHVASRGQLALEIGQILARVRPVRQDTFLHVRRNEADHLVARFLPRNRFGRFAFWGMRAGCTVVRGLAARWFAAGCRGQLLGLDVLADGGFLLRRDALAGSVGRHHGAGFAEVLGLGLLRPQAQQLLLDGRGSALILHQLGLVEHGQIDRRRGSLALEVALVSAVFEKPLHEAVFHRRVAALLHVLDTKLVLQSVGATLVFQPLLEISVLRGIAEVEVFAGQHMHAGHAAVLGPGSLVVACEVLGDEAR